MNQLVLRNPSFIGSCWLGNTVSHWRQVQGLNLQSLGHFLIGLGELILPFTGLIELIVSRSLYRGVPNHSPPLTSLQPDRVSVSPAPNSPIAAFFPRQPAALESFSLDNFKQDPHAYGDKSCFKDLFPSLKECPCSIVRPQQRIALEKLTLANIQDKFPDKQKTFNILSLGAGDCLQELIYISKLYDAGYRNIDLMVIDPSEETPKALEDLRRFTQEHMPLLSLRVHQTQNIQNKDSLVVAEFLPGYNPQLILLIDPDSSNPNIRTKHPELYQKPPCDQRLTEKQEEEFDQVRKDLFFRPLANTENLAVYLIDNKWKFKNCIFSYAVHPRAVGCSLVPFRAQSLYIEENNLQNSLQNLKYGLNAQGQWCTKKMGIEQRTDQEKPPCL